VSAPPSYRERLRVEGLAMAACGATGSVLLIALVPSSHRWPWNTIGQLALAGVVIERWGTRLVRRWIDDAVELQPGQEGGGEPTPLWQLPVIVAALASLFGLLPETGLPGSERAGWDAGLRVTGGCLLVGLAQAIRFEAVVAEDEERRKRRYVRIPGSSLLRGTRLGYTPAR
jgi:hypothetical protein